VAWAEWETEWLGGGGAHDFTARNSTQGRAEHRPGVHWLLWSGTKMIHGLLVPMVVGRTPFGVPPLAVCKLPLHTKIHGHTEDSSRRNGIPHSSHR
jgi:hypothetical protein